MPRNKRLHPNTIPIGRLRAAVEFDPDLGEFTWRERKDVPRYTNTRFAGKRAFTTNSHGYRTARIDGVSLLAHRCAWALSYGEWLHDEIDHINGDRSDNRLCNLRLVTTSDQAKNQKLRVVNTSGYNGVSLIPKTGRWRARIKHDGKQKHIGVYACKTAAYIARKLADVECGFYHMHGERK